MARPVLLLLPGMDGTTELLSEAIEKLEAHYEVRAVSYPVREQLSYETLVEIARGQLPPRREVLILAESFSGPVGILLASSHKPCRRLVLCASFAKGPWPLWIPSITQGWALNLIRHGPIPPARSLSPLTMGEWANAKWHKKIERAAKKLAPQVLRQRLEMALKVDVSQELRKVSARVLYLQASHDCLVEDRYGKHVKQVLPKATIERIEGPHFLLQAQPDQCIAKLVAWDQA